MQGKSDVFCQRREVLASCTWLRHPKASRSKLLERPEHARYQADHRPGGRSGRRRGSRMAGEGAIPPTSLPWRIGVSRLELRCDVQHFVCHHFSQHLDTHQYEVALLCLVLRLGPIQKHCLMHSTACCQTISRGSTGFTSHAQNYVRSTILRLAVMMEHVMNYSWRKRSLLSLVDTCIGQEKEQAHSVAAAK